MSDTSPEGPTEPDAEQINTAGVGNTDLTGQAREIVEQSENSATGPTPGGG